MCSSPWHTEEPMKITVWMRRYLVCQYSQLIFILYRQLWREYITYCIKYTYNRNMKCCYFCTCTRIGALHIIFADVFFSTLLCLDLATSECLSKVTKPNMGRQGCAYVYIYTKITSLRNNGWYEYERIVVWLLLSWIPSSIFASNVPSVFSPAVIVCRHCIMVFMLP